MAIDQKTVRAIAADICDALKKHTREMAGTQHTDTKAALEEVIATYGAGAALNVIAHHMNSKEDGRISAANKEWAQGVVDNMTAEEREGFTYTNGKSIYLSALDQHHMTVLDSLTTKAREHTAVPEQIQETQNDTPTPEIQSDKEAPIGSLIYPDSGEVVLYYSEEKLIGAYKNALYTLGAYSGMKYEILSTDPVERKALEDELIRIIRDELGETEPVGQLTYLNSGEPALFYYSEEEMAAAYKDALQTLGAYAEVSYEVLLTDPAEKEALGVELARIAKNELEVQFPPVTPEQPPVPVPDILGHWWTSDMQLDSSFDESLKLGEVPDGYPEFDVFNELRELYERCRDYERELDELHEQLEEYKEDDNQLPFGQPGAVVNAAYAIEERIRELQEKLAELKRRIMELIERLKTAIKGKTEAAIAAVKGQITGVRAGLDSVKTDMDIVRQDMAEKVKTLFTKPEKTATEIVLEQVKKGDLVAFHQSISATTDKLPVIFAAALGRNDKIGNAMAERVLESLEKREIDLLTDVERSSAEEIVAAKSRAFSKLDPIQALSNLIAGKKFTAAEKLLTDKRIHTFLRSERGGDALYAALQSKNAGIARGIASHLDFTAYNRALKLSLYNLDAKAAGNIIRLGADAGLFIKLTALEDKSNPFLSDKQRKFMNDLAKFWNNEQTRNEPEQAQEAEYGDD